jgi:hypothetical protein
MDIENTTTAATAVAPHPWLISAINQCDPPGWHGPETVVEAIEFFPAVPGEADAILRVYYRWRHVDINLRHYPILSPLKSNL